MSGIYIHVPFCKQKCTYCDFASFPQEIGKTESYFACLYREIEGRGRALKGKVFNTVYIGGGTPSVVPAKFIVGALKQVRKFFTLTEDAEITIEINPGTIDEEKVKAYKSAGINRFSIGLQTGYDEQLKALNRIHTAKDFLFACKMLKGENLSADVLIGLENQTAEEVKKTLELAIAGGVSHISVYALTAEPGTPIYTKYLNGELLSDDEVADIYQQVIDYLQDKKFYRYEISNFAKSGFESKHNLNYWDRGEYIGLGVSASSFIDNRRFTNTYNINEYINAVIYNKMPEISSEMIEGDDATFEFVMLGLRKVKGITFSDFEKQFGLDFKKVFATALKEKERFLDITESGVKIKPEYLYVQNDILTAFMK